MATVATKRVKKEEGSEASGEDNVKGTSASAAPAKKGINWAGNVINLDASHKPESHPLPPFPAIFIMLMMGLPALVTLGLTAYDYLYPQQAVQREVRTRLNKCYERAKPGETVDLDKILKKYEGKEDILFSILRNKYPKVKECH